MALNLDDFEVSQKKCKVVENHRYKEKFKKGETVDEVDSADLGDFKMIQRKKNKTHYGIRVVTARSDCSGSCDPNIYLVLVGKNHRSNKICIQGSLFKRNTLRSGYYNDIIVEIDDDEGLGQVEVVVIEMDRSLLHPLGYYHVDFIEVHSILSDEAKKAHFPFYHWIKANEIMSCTSKTCTQKDIKESKILLCQREKQLVSKRNIYAWAEDSHCALPAFVDATVLTLNVDADFEVMKAVTFGYNLRNYATEVIETKICPKKLNMQDYARLEEKFGESNLNLSELSRWATDVEFGRQMLNGVNPVVIERCISLPENFPVTDEMLSFNRGTTLVKEMEAGRVYICNMKIMDGLLPRDGYVAPAPICLLHVNEHDQLVPIAIQIRQGIREEDKIYPNPIFLPSDSLIDWTLAKIYYQAAHSQFHQLSTHYMSCHAAMECYAVGTVRNLPDPHPIYKLLYPHFRYTMAINTAARAALVSDGGIIDQLLGIGGLGRVELMKRAYDAYSVHWTNIKRNAKERGVDDPNKLPGYYYRDDGFKIWDALQELATKIINYFYSEDKDVEEDLEIQYWAADLHNNGFRGYRGNTPGHDFPEKFSTKESLIEHCTLIMFTGSAQHSSVNFGQYTYYGFAPNAPPGVRLPPPTEKGKATMETLLATLPDDYTASSLVGVAYALSQYGPSERFLGDLLQEYYSEDVLRGYVKDFQNKLEDIGAEMKKRNEDLEKKYIYMLPKRITNSITM